MFKKHLFLLALAAVLCNNQIVAMDMMQGEMLPEEMMSDDVVRSCKCKNFKCINVCGNVTVGGSEVVAGSVTASSFITPAGVLFNGLRNYAVLSNQAAVTTGNAILWASTPAANLSSGITFNNVTGLITLPSTGLFLVQYTVRINIPEGTATTPSAQAQLQQGTGTVAPITQTAVIKNNATVITTAETGDIIQTQISGYAFINSANGVNLNLLITLSNGVTIPLATLTDANAQMVILQLN